MKSKVVLQYTLFTALILTGGVQAKQVDISRGQTWARLQIKSKLTQTGIGMLFMAGSRYNYSFEKTIDEVPVTADPMSAWLQELWLGPTYSRKLGNKLRYATNVLYRPQFWYIDNATKKRYLRHTVSNSHSIFRSTGPVTLHSRVMLWNHFPAKTGEDATLDNEFYIRPLIGVRIPIHKKFSIMLDDELFLKTTADSDDLDGSEVLNKNILWSGLVYNALPQLQVTLGYVNMWTNLEQRDDLSRTVMDHYVYLNLAYMVDFTR